jgi:hypothetical protein
MAAKTNPAVSQTFKAKARQVLAFAKQQKRDGKSPAELFLVVFGAHGKINITFPTQRERAAFERTEEYAALRNVIETVLAPSQSASVPSANGHLSVTLRLPKSVHTTLMKEAAAEGVSLDQLCLSKLVAQLRELV